MIVSAVGEGNPPQHFFNASFQRGPVQAVKMALVAQIFVGGELGIDALGLEDDTDLAAKAIRIFGGIMAHDESATRSGNHQRRKDAKECGFAAAVLAKKSE